MKQLKIHIYTVTFNEQHFVKNFLEAYKGAERIVAYDNQSTDNTVELLSKDPRVEVRSWDSGSQIRDDKYLEIKNNCWKESKGLADWVIVVDFDEIFCRAEHNNYNLSRFSLDLEYPYDEGYNIIKPFGYNMISLYSPLGAKGHPYDYSKNAVYHWPQEKCCCFRPDQLKEINFVPGCHAIFPEPVGEERILFTPEYKLLHFKHWNIDLYMEKMRISASRMSEINLKNGWGGHYLWEPQKHFDNYIAAYKASKPLFRVQKTDKLYS